MDKSIKIKEFKIKWGLPPTRKALTPIKKYSNNVGASHTHRSELWLAFYILQFTSDKAPHFDNLRLGIGCRSPPRFAPAYKPEQNERNNSMNGRKNFHTNLKNQPNEPVGERVVSERGRKELPPSTRGGENLKPNRYYEHKQHAFDSYCKRCWNARHVTAIGRSAVIKTFCIFGRTVRGRCGPACSLRSLLMGVYGFSRGKCCCANRERPIGHSTSTAVTKRPGNFYDALVSMDDRRTDSKVHGHGQKNGQYSQV